MTPQAIKHIHDDQESRHSEEMDRMNTNNAKKSPPGISPSKICAVCGDRAYGYNFNAITCESCKAFFRRNALTSKTFRCSFTEQCEITVLTRRFCQKCRLDKCFTIGMDKDCIMSDEDKAQKRLKIAENKARKRLKDRAGEDEVSSSKMIKREENDDSNNSWIICDKETSPVHGEEQSCESPDNTMSNNREIPPTLSPPNSSNNQTVSVIRNNSHLDTHIITSSSSRLINDNNHLDHLLPKKPNTYNASYDNYTDELQNINATQIPVNYDVNFTQDVNMINQIPSMPNGSLHQHRFMNTIFDPNVRQMSTEREEDHVMIRSMLTAPTPNNEPPKTAPVISPEQQMCDAALNPSRSSNAPSKADVARDVLQDVESIYRIPVENNSIENILCEAIKLEFEAYTSLSQINSSSRELNDAERAKLNELIVANKALLAPLDEDHVSSLVSDEYRFKPTQGHNNLTLLGIINLTAVAIRRLIKMSKKINAFKNMCEEDQVALLKGGCTEMMILRSTMTYDCAGDTWKIPHSQESMSSIKAEVLKLAKGNVYEEHDRFIRTFDPRWRMDENIILIMCAIVLFTPDRQRVVHSDVIKLEQNSYYYLLRRYLESIYPGCEAKSTFLKLIQKIMELHKLADDVIGVYLDVNPSHVEPLLIEIFDLKQQH